MDTAGKTIVLHVPLEEFDRFFAAVPPQYRILDRKRDTDHLIFYYVGLRLIIERDEG